MIVKMLWAVNGTRKRAGQFTSARCSPHSLDPLLPTAAPQLGEGEKAPALLIFVPRPSRAAALVGAGTGMRAVPWAQGSKGKKTLHQLEVYLSKGNPLAGLRQIRYNAASLLNQTRFGDGAGFSGLLLLSVHNARRVPPVR